MPEANSIEGPLITCILIIIITFLFYWFEKQRQKSKGKNVPLVVEKSSASSSDSSGRPSPGDSSNDPTSAETRELECFHSKTSFTGVNARSQHPRGEVREKTQGEKGFFDEPRIAETPLSKGSSTDQSFGQKAHDNISYTLCNVALSDPERVKKMEHSEPSKRSGVRKEAREKDGKRRETKQRRDMRKFSKNDELSDEGYKISSEKKSNSIVEKDSFLEPSNAAGENSGARRTTDQEESDWNELKHLEMTFNSTEDNSADSRTTDADPATDDEFEYFMYDARVAAESQSIDICKTLDTSEETTKKDINNFQSIEETYDQISYSYY